MFIHLSVLISWAKICLGNILGIIPSPGSLVVGSIGGGRGLGRSGSMQYHCFGIFSSSRSIFLLGMSFVSYCMSYKSCVDAILNLLCTICTLINWQAENERQKNSLRT